MEQINTFHLGEQIEDGIYLSPKIPVAEDELYAESFLGPNGESWKLVFLCRVKPEAVKVCPKADDYWLVNNTEDIRPYKILMKRIARVEPAENNKVKN